MFENEPIKTSLTKRPSPPKEINKVKLPEPQDIGQLYLSQFSRSDDYEGGDGYEVPIKYTREPKPVKSILRSPSPSAPATVSSPISSLDRPLSVKPTQITQPQRTVTSAIVHTTRTDDGEDEEIERENPFREEFLGHRPYENIYEELRFDDDPYQTTKEESYKSSGKTTIDKKERPKSAYYSEYSNEYSEVLPKSYHSNEHLLDEASNERTILKKPTSKSTGSLLIDRPTHKPPLPPKPKQPSNIKHADVVQNEALKTFQSEMERGDFYEYRHDHNTNKIIKIKHDVNIKLTPQTEKTSEVIETLRTTSSSNISPETPLSPVPQNNPSYTKVNKKACSTDRPSVSPPPPPINLSTLPSIDKLRNIQSDDGEIVEILPTKLGILPQPQRAEFGHENSPDNILVTEATHREILLQENELRKAMQHEDTIKETSITTSRIPIRKAPPPPPPVSETTDAAQADSVSQRSDDSSSGQSVHTTMLSNMSPNQIFPQTQILPVQYSHLPIPQQPGYFHTFSPTPMAVGYPSGIPIQSGFTSYVVSDLMQQTVVPNMGFVGQPCLSMPLSSFHNNPNFQSTQNYVNVVTNPTTIPTSHPLSPSAAAPMPPPSKINNNWTYSENTYQNVINRQLLQEQQQQQKHHEQNYYHHQHSINIPKTATSFPSPPTPIHSSTTAHSEEIINNNTVFTTTQKSNIPTVPSINTTENMHNENKNKESSTIISSNISSFTVTSTPSSLSLTEQQSLEQMSPSPLLISSPSYENTTIPISELSPIRIVSPTQNSSSNYREPEQDENKRTLITFGKQTSV